MSRRKGAAILAIRARWVQARADGARLGTAQEIPVIVGAVLFRRSGVHVAEHALNLPHDGKNQDHPQDGALTHGFAGES